MIRRALARLQLGRALLCQEIGAGLNQPTRISLYLSEDADPGIPILQQAKREYARLQ